MNGKRQPNSGATPFMKGDVITDKFLVECKTKMTKSISHTIKKEWLDKNKEEAFAMQRPYSALAFDFGDGQNYYIIDEDLFLRLLNYIKECEE